MASKKISEEEQLKVRNKAKAELTRLQKTLADDATRKMIDAFKNKFTVCERVYKTVLLDYRKAAGKQVKIENLKITMQQVDPALNSFAGYGYDLDLLRKIFGSEKKLNNRSAKKIRDLLTHDLNNSALEELKKREDELHGYMDEFLETIATFDERQQAE